MARPHLPRALPRQLWQTLGVSLVAIASAVFSVRSQAADTPPADTGLIVIDAAALRAAPRDAAPLLTPLWRGEAVQLRGVRGDWLQVWDLHRERGGFVRATAVLPVASGPAALPELAAQLRLLRQQPGAESLGIGMAAAVIARADPAWLAAPSGAEMLDTLVMLQQRLAARAQGAGAAAAAQQTVLAAQADVAARYGFGLQPLARADGGQQLCPNTDPARLLRGHPAATVAQRTRAALALTRADCLPADALPSQRLTLLEQHAAWLDGLDLAKLTPTDRNRLLMRRAAVLSSLAFARRGGDAQTPAAAALAAWGQLIPAELTDDDAPALRDAAIRLSPQRWVVQAAVQAAGPVRRLGRFELRLEAGGPGETCLRWGTVADGRMAQRCSHGVVHLASARVAPDGSALALAVQPLDGWTELWRLDAAGQVQVLPPSAEAPGLGAVEWAGWAPGKDGVQLLVAREADAGGRLVRRFEVLGADVTQPPLRWAGDPGVLAAFQRSADPAWRAGSPLLR